MDLVIFECLIEKNKMFIITSFIMPKPSVTANKVFEETEAAIRSRKWKFFLKNGKEI